MKKIWYREQAGNKLRNINYWGDEKSVLNLMQYEIRQKGKPSFLFIAEINPKKTFKGTAADFARKYRVLKKWRATEKAADSLQAETDLFVPILKKHGYDAIQYTDDQIMVINPNIVKIKSVITNAYDKIHNPPQKTKKNNFFPTPPKLRIPKIPISNHSGRLVCQHKTRFGFGISRYSNR